MKEEEIREMDIGENALTMGTMAIAQNAILREIAAQLAEITKLLRDGVINVNNHY